MNTDKSIFLHCVRWVSALFVLIGHSHLIGGGGGAIFVFLASHAHAAVMVFFVLSGYVIASTVERKRALGFPLKDYYFDRFSRIYSVLIPAIILTVLLDAIGVQLFQQRYLDPALLPQDHFVIRFLVNIFSLQGIWGYRVQLGSNPALWSIGYEFCYYILYGLLIWRPRYWQLFILCIAVVVGPNVLMYGLVWLLGVLAFRIQSKSKINFLVGLCGLVIANHIFQYNPVSYMPEVLRDFIFGIVVMIFILANPKLPRNKYLLRVNLEMAEFSYSSYAYHYPLMFMAYSVLVPTEMVSWSLVLVSLIITRCFYEVTEKKRYVLKNTIVKYSKIFKANP
jgi:peptidoglycan/LPS O-acetylase OafA/YrhL